MIFTREEYKRIQFYNYYQHFNQRLRERYKIEITIEEYTLLFQKTSNKETVQKFSTKRRSVIIFIKNIPVLVVRDTRCRVVKTALPMVNKFKKPKVKKDDTRISTRNL